MKVLFCQRESLLAITLSILAALVSLCAIGCSSDSEPELPRLRENYGATVMIRTGESAHGTGVVVSHCGHILTNEHVVNASDGNLRVYTESSGEPFGADVIAVDEAHDLAIIHINHTFEHVAIVETDDTELHPGDESYSIGYPHDMGQTVSRGYVRMLRFSDDNPDYPPLIRDATMLRQRLEPGTSGAGIYSVRHGRLIGLMSMNFWIGKNMFQILTNEIVVPLRHIRPFLNENQIPYCRPPPPLHERIASQFREWLNL